MSYKRRNPIDWAKHAYWFEAEGSKTSSKDPEYLDTVSQNVARREIVDTLCKELQNAGFRARVRPLEKGRTLACNIKRIEEQKCFVERTKSYYLAQETRQWAEEYLRAIEGRRRRRPRIHFKCPE